MIREKIKWVDPFTQAILTILVFFILGLLAIFVFKRFKVGSTTILLGAGLGTGRMFYMLKNEAGLILENDYPGEFYIKPENTDTPIKITPNTPLPVAADGININGTIYKIRTGTNVKITRNGKVIAYSPLSALVNEKVNQDKFNPTEWHQWKALFEIK